MKIPEIFLDNSNKPIFKPNIVFNYAQFKDMFMGDLKQLQKEFGQLKKAVNTLFNRYNSSISIRVSNIFGEEFTFALYGKTINLWNSSGGTSLGFATLSDNLSVRKEQLQNIIKKLEKFSNGIIECGLCGKDMNYQENLSHRYFAGLYCQTCWNDEMKEIESKENYN